MFALPVQPRFLRVGSLHTQLSGCTLFGVVKRMSSMPFCFSFVCFVWFWFGFGFLFCDLLNR